MYTIRKKLRVEYAHQLDSSYSTECQTIHGHSGIVEVLLENRSLNQDGMVIDFKQVKDIIKDIVMAYDHALIFSKKMIDERPQYVNTVLQNSPNVIIFPTNPTAENFAKKIYDDVKTEIQKLYPVIGIASVRFHETETGWAEYREDV